MSSSWTFGRKLGTGISAIVLLTLLMGVVAFYALRVVVEQKDAVITHTAQNLIDVQKMRASMQRESADIRAFLLTGDEKYVAAAAEGQATFTAAVQAVRGRGVSPVVEGKLETILEAEHAHQQETENLFARRRVSGDLSAISAEFDRLVAPRAEVLFSRVQDLETLERRRLDEGREKASDAATQAITLLIALGLITMIIAIAIAFLLTRGLTRQIGASVQHVRSSSAELQATAGQQASGAKEQATAMKEITVTIGELLTTSRQIAESSQRVSKIANETATGARDGDDSITNAQDALNGIRSQVDTIVLHMLDLGRKSQQIGGILEIINELAEQTNILAINATIEAAGAGESGRRFAVVGEEIRKLADRVGGSTKDIRVLIEEIRSAVNTTVMATEAGTKTVEAGTNRFAELAVVFERIAQSVETTTDAAREIELSTKQQASAVEQVNVAIANVAQATRETEAGSAQTLQTASQLAKLSDELGRLIQANPPS